MNTKNKRAVPEAKPKNAQLATGDSVELRLLHLEPIKIVSVNHKAIMIRTPG
jgi:hypothetical protein